MTDVEFSGVMDYLRNGCGGRPWPKDQVVVYFDLLGHFPLPVFREAARLALLEMDIPCLPTAGRLHRLASQVVVIEPEADRAARIARERAESAERERTKARGRRLSPPKREQGGASE